ncbi:hypothetical protein Y032_0012g1679 [Ancylostoma ceylanicum]|uniref:Uncharacterized protein n=1 Tax=Ancylostoma ceylanicum TaxID=53326 RepID=A0A016VED3_9BILA|nr:hypothetical protein Y032_0012g1679 [Ancylostoma ceylanicum]
MKCRYDIMYQYHGHENNCGPRQLHKLLLRLTIDVTEEHFEITPMSIFHRAKAKRTEKMVIRFAISVMNNLCEHASAISQAKLAKINKISKSMNMSLVVAGCQIRDQRDGLPQWTHFYLDWS